MWHPQTRSTRWAHASLARHLVQFFCAPATGQTDPHIGTVQGTCDVWHSRLVRSSAPLALGTGALIKQNHMKRASAAALPHAGLLQA